MLQNNRKQASSVGSDRGTIISQHLDGGTKQSQNAEPVQVAGDTRVTTTRNNAGERANMGQILRAETGRAGWKGRGENQSSSSSLNNGERTRVIVDNTRTLTRQ